MLGLPCLLALAHPFQFAFERFLAALVLARLLFQPLGLLFEPRRVVPLVGNAAAPVELEDPAGDVVEEVAVMGDDQDRTLVVDQVLLQPCDGFGVKVVGGLVQQQHVGVFEQQLAECHAALFPARKAVDVGIVGRATQRLHRDVDLGIQIPQVFRVDLVLQLGHLVGGLVRIVHGKFVVTVKDRLFLGHALHHVFTD